ncbi:MAG TPA: hypothetical protein VFK80_04045, partial [Limnochordia bacterium]|nr:hypothetical protein [Limnochordia bacterium]
MTESGAGVIDPRSELGRLLGVPVVRAEPADRRIAGAGRSSASAGGGLVGADSDPVGARAWRIVTADGQAFFAKQADSAELTWRAALAAETAVVPRVIAARSGWLVAEWIDGVTLDDALQGVHDGPRLAAALLSGVREL